MAIEIKPDIATLTERSEFHRALTQIKSVKALSRQVSLPDFMVQDIPKDYFRIPCAVFSQKSQSADKTIDYMMQCTKKVDFQSVELPDVIFTLDNDIIYHTAMPNYSVFSSHITKQKPGWPQETYIHLHHTNKSLILATFLFLLYAFPPPEMLMSEPIIKRYLLPISEVNMKFYFPD